MTEASPIPPPRSDDDEDVHWALSTASALWARGDTGEALKWLRRAAETASDQNRDQRSLELFKAAADATSLLGRTSGSVPAPPGHAHGSQTPPPPNASSPPSAAHASHPPPRTSGTPPPPRVSATPPPPRTSATPPPPRTSAAPPAGASAPPLGSPAPPPRTSATPAPPAVGAPARTSALPSASTPRPPGALPGPIAAARAVLGKDPASVRDSARPSSAVTRKRKNTLDERFQFPDDEVTLQRDVRSLDRSRPAVQPPAPPPDEPAVSAMAPTAPHPGASPTSARGAATAPRSAAGATAAARGASAATSGRAAGSGAPASAAHATTTRTILSAGTSPRPSGVQPLGSAVSAAAARAMSRQPTRKIDTTPPPVDDLDEQTSVLSGDEAELDFDGSATGENPLEDPRTMHDEPPADAVPDGHERTPTDAGSPEATPGASATDEPLYAPSIRPQPMTAEPARAGAAATPGASSTWPAIRVALRRDAGGVRIEALGLDAATPPGAVAAVLVAHDAASADALARLLEPRG